MYLIYDTETTGLPRNYSAPVSDSDNWPRMVQLAWQLHDENGVFVERGDLIVRPEGYTIPFNAEKVHGISTDRAREEGQDLADVLSRFNQVLEKTKVIIGHNIEFDINIAGAEFYRKDIETPLQEIPVIDTKSPGTEFCKLPGGKGGGYKWPTLEELYRKLFDSSFSDAHNAAADVEATARAFFKMVQIGVIKPGLFPVSEQTVAYIRDNPDEVLGLKTYSSLKKPETETQEETVQEIKKIEVSLDDQLLDAPFVHLHCHSQYSVLQSTARINDLVKKAIDEQMPALALTDLGNMFGVFNFVKTCLKHEIKPIVGCEFYLVEDRLVRKFTKENKDHRTQHIFLAKNKEGYQNLIALSSIGYMEGYYAALPRIDKQVVVKHKENLITTTGGIYGEIPHMILNVGETQAEEAFVWWHEQFGADFYVQLQRHGLEEEDRVNEVLLRFARKYGVKCIAANDVYYVEQKDSEAHDVLLCIKENELKNTPIGRGRGYRYGFPNNQYFFKTPREMKELFHDIPEAITNISEILEKIEPFELERDVLLPAYELPEGFSDQNEYLRHLTYLGAEKKYPKITEEIRQRLDHELQIIKEMGFPGYFLIVQDFTSAARNMGVYVGPGRGSAAGSAVAFCVGITNIDPLKYDLLFERFLNPERISMPDIDIDFDDEGRNKIIDYVVEKYGRNQVAQIVTYGTMGPKLAIRDVARVMDIPLSEADRVAKLVPEKPGLSFDKAFSESKELAQVRDSESDSGSAVRQAVVLEGSVRNTGIHACGVIITPDELTRYVPLSISKDADLLVTQFDNKVVEDAGLLKMDFLGLKTLSILKTAIELVEESYGNKYNLDDIPLDDENTYNLYQRGDTVGTFQFESDGMRKHLKNLKPTNIDDLIAMNALYRPGPMEFIPNYIDRKHGREEVEYLHPMMEPILKTTYGIMVYQEQIMQVAQVLAGYSLGGADILRRAMGKKKLDVMAKEKVKFVEGAKNNGIDEETAEKIFKQMERFASYGFNKSHSAAYSVLAYQTAYFKANYPAEYMASVLTHNYGDIKKVMKFIEEANRMGIAVDQPNINTGTAKFTVKNGRIQYGMEAIKGVGSSAIEHVVEIRNKEGKFASIFDFATRIDPRICNRKSIENLVQAGAFDTLHQNRAQLFESLEDVMQFASRKQQEMAQNQVNLFAVGGPGTALMEPKLRDVPAWSNMTRLKKERELLGFYLSGHPLDKFRDECKLFCSTNLGPTGIASMEPKSNVTVAGIITTVRQAVDKKGRPFCFLELEDEFGAAECIVFSKQYDVFKNLLEVDNIIMMQGKVDGWSGQNKIIVDSLTRIENVREENAGRIKVRLSVNLDDMNNAEFDQVADIMNKFPGKSPVGIDVYAGGNKPIRMNARKYVIDCSEHVIEDIRKIVGDENVGLEKIEF